VGSWDLKNACNITLLLAPEKLYEAFHSCSDHSFILTYCNLS